MGHPAMFSRALVFALVVPLASSMRRTVQHEEATAGVASPLGYKDGDVFENFRLESHIGNDALKSGIEETSSFLEGSSIHTEATGKNPLVSFPRKMLERFNPPTLLGAGSFGEAWLAEGLPGTTFEGQKVVVKLLYIKQGGRYVHVTRKMTARSNILRREVAGAAAECNFAMNLQKAARDMGDYATYAQRLMGCYAHNYKKVTHDSVPIYLVLENCGKNDLAKHIKDNKGTLDSAHIASIIRQINEGLLYLSKMDPPVIHHDLKPANIVVKATASGYPTVHLIDFGGMLNAGQAYKTGGSVATYVFAPPEWFQGYIYKAPAHAFDMYAVGNTLADMAFGETISGYYWDGRRDEPNFKNIKSIGQMDSRSAFVQKFQGSAKAHGCSGLASMAQDENAYNFIIDGWVKMVAAAPADRPSPEELLKHAWLASAESPSNNDWKMWEPPAPKPVAPKPVVAANEEEADGVDSDSEEEEAVGEADGFQGCLNVCDTCFEDPNPKHTKKGRRLMECGIESENMQKYDPKKVFMKLGPEVKYCDKSFSTEMVGRNRHGRDGSQTYFVWNCGKVTESEAKAWANARVKLMKPQRKGEDDEE